MDRLSIENYHHAIKISEADVPSPEESSSPYKDNHQHQHQHNPLHQKDQSLPKTPTKMMRIERKTSDAMAMSILLHKDHNCNGNGDEDDALIFSPMGLLDIMRESSALLRANSSTLMWTLFILICPLSTLILSTGFISSQIRISHGHSLASALIPAPLHDSFIFKSLSETLISILISSPLFFTIWLLAKAFIIFTVSSSYSSRKPLLKLFSSIAFKLWKRLAYTCIWISGLLFAMFVIAGAAISVVTGSDLPEDIETLLEMAMAVTICVVLANMVIVANLATVVCVVEDHTVVGWSAILRSVELMKGRRQVALSLFLTTTACAAMVESLYQHRVIGVPHGTYHIDVASRLWEAPLLIFMYSFLYLYDTIMSCVFYFTCTSASPTSPSAAYTDD